MSAGLADINEAIHRIPIAAALFELSTMTVMTANAAALDLIGLDIEPVGLNILSFATDPEIVGAPLKMIADKTILGYEATVSLRHADGGAVEVIARVVAVPAHEDVAVAVAATRRRSEPAAATVLPLFAGMLDGEHPWDEVVDGAELLRVVADRLAGAPGGRPIRLPWMQQLTSRQWEIVGRLVRGERVPAIAEALFVSQSTVRNHLHTVFEKAGVHSQAELISLIRRGGASSSIPE